MKQLLAILIFFISLSCSNRDWYNSYDWDKNSVGTGCGFAAQTTEPVNKLFVSLIDKDYTEIRAMLNDKSAEIQYLGVIATSFLVEENQIVLSQAEKKKIGSIQQSSKKVHFCSGCTLWERASLKRLLDKKQQHYMTRYMRDWITTIYNQ